MKKIFTVLMALGIALCTVANPTFSVAEKLDMSKVKTPKMEKQFTPVEKTSKVVRVDKQEARQAMVEARQAKAVAPMAINGVRQVEAMPVAEKQALPVVNNKQRAAAQATAATDTVEIVATYWAWEYYESDNDWYTTLIDATQTYEIKLDYVSDTQAGTFTEADCLMDYTGMYIYDEEGSRTIVGFTEVDIVVTDDENGLALNAELLSTDNVLYVVSAFIAPLPEPKATVELAYANATLEDGTRSSGTFQFWGDENGVYTSILLASDQVEGEYNKFDMYVDYANYIMFVDGADTTFVDFLDLNAVVTKEDKTYNLVADALGSDTIMYHITMSYTKPAPTDTIDIVATNMVVDEFEFWGMVFCTVQASNDEYTVTLDMANGLPMGELTSEDFNVEYSSVYRIADAEEIVFEEIISATVSEVEGKPAVKAQVVGVDNIVYNLDLSYVVPEPTDTVNVVFDDVVEAQYYGESADYYIVNENENYIVVLDIFEERGNLMGEYTAEDFDMYYTQLGVIEAGDTTAVEIADAKAVVTPVEEGIVLIEAELIGMNAVLYKVSTKADVSNKGLQYDATEGFLVDEYTTEDLYTINDQSANGYIMLDVESADGNDLMGLVFWVDGADENTIIPTGTYPIDASGEAGTVLASTGYGANGLTYSLYATLDEEGYINIPCWFMVGGIVVVSEENGILSITVDAVNSNNLPIYITCEYDLNTKQGLQYDMTEGSVERTYSDADVVEINTEYVAQYGELYLDITAADGSDMISLAFFVEATDDEITIPAGVYPINDSGEYGTVYASPGVIDGSIYPSFYGIFSPNGGITVPCYFMVGGQVVVENVNGALKLTIDALNSYDVPAHIVYEATPEPTVVTEMAGVVKRALQNGESTIVLTHEADGTAHIYEVANGTILELLQNGVIAVDPENAGDYLAISDIALTEDGKLVATNYMQTQSGDDYVDAGYQRGETRIYIWNDLHGAPSVLFTSKMSSNWFRSKQGLTMAVKGTSDNMEIFMTGIHATKAWARVSSYRVINGVYEEPAVNHNDHYFFYDVADAVALETTVGTQYELTASPLGAMNWILDAELINPVEIVEPETNNVEISSCVALSTDLGKKFNGTSIVTVGEQVLMVAPYATAEGLLAGVKVLDITAGLDAATEVATADLEAAVEATAAATAVAVAENVLTITLVADATIYTLNVELESEPDYMLIEDEITNLVIDLESMAIIGGPSTMWQVEVFLGLAEDDNMDGQWSLSPESSVAIMGFDARLIDGYVYDIDVNAPAAKAVLYVEDSGFFYEIKLNMTSTPTEAIVVVVEDATVTIDTIPLFGDQVDYALKMTADWTYAEDGVTYPVLVEVPVYYPEATEPSEMTCTVTIGGMGDTDPWLGFGEGTLTITTEGGVVTAKGIVANPYTGVAFDVTVSGKLSQSPGTGVDNVQVEVKTVKMIKNGQLIINRGGKAYNAIGVQVK